MAKEHFFFDGSKEIVGLLDEAARRSGLSRGQTFEELLELRRLCTVRSADGGRVPKDGGQGVWRSAGLGGQPISNPNVMGRLEPVLSHSW